MYATAVANTSQSLIAILKSIGGTVQRHPFFTQEKPQEPATDTAPPALRKAP